MHIDFQYSQEFLSVKFECEMILVDALHKTLIVMYMSQSQYSFPHCVLDKDGKLQGSIFDRHRSTQYSILITSCNLATHTATVTY